MFKEGKNILKSHDSHSKPVALFEIFIVDLAQESKSNIEPSEGESNS